MEDRTGLMINFEIGRVYAGWFDVVFRYNNKDVSIRASDAWDYDSPKYFLQMLSECYRADRCSKFAVFDEEPGTYYVCLLKDTKVTLTVFYSTLTHDELTIDFERELSAKEIMKCVNAGKDKIILQEEIDLDYFIHTVIRAFEEYELAERNVWYEENWMDFPMVEFEKLKSDFAYQLREKSVIKGIEKINRNIDMMEEKEQYIYKTEQKDFNLNCILNHYMFLENNEKTIMESADVSLEVLLYCKYYWFTRYIELYTEKYGEDVGMAEQQYKLLEELDQRLSDSIDWDIIKMLEEHNGSLLSDDKA